MALGTYDELKASLSGWLHRADVAGAATGVGVDEIVSDWIALFEAEANATLRLRVMQTEQTLTMTPASRYVILPDGFIEPMALWLVTDPAQEPEQLNQLPVTSLPRVPLPLQPKYWAVDGVNLAFDTQADQAYGLVFRFLKAFALSEAGPTNWLLTNFPNLYLYGSLRHSPLYLMQDARASAWDARYAQALQVLEAKEARADAQVTLSADPALTRGRPFNIFRGD